MIQTSRINIPQMGTTHPQTKLEFDLKEGERFIAALYETPEHKVTIQTFDDCQTPNHKKRENLSKILFGTLRELETTLTALQNQGAGIFLMINSGDLKGRSAKNVTHLTSYFYDEDNNRDIAPPIKETIVVQSKNGPQGYFKAKPNQSLKNFSQIQKLISLQLGTDKSVNDTSRVMRLPGSFHLKDPDSPFKITIKSLNEVSYSEQDLIDAFKKGQAASEVNTTKPEKAEKTTSMDKTQMGLLQDELNRRRILSSAYSINWPNLLKDAAIKFTSREGGSKIDVVCPKVQEHTNKETTPTSSTTIMKAQNNSVSLKCQHSHGDEIDITHILSGMSDELILKNCTVHYSSKAAEVGRQFQIKMVTYIRYYRGDWYLWNGSAYEEVSQKWIEAKISKFIQEQNINTPGKLNAFLTEVLAYLKGMAVISFEESPFWIGESPLNGERLISLKSGLFRVDLFLNEKTVDPLLIPHDPNFFTTNTLPYDLNLSAPCERFLTFLNEMIPDKEIQDGIQEFFGSCLLREENYNLLLLLKGDGANGKSVLLTVLRAMLGTQNVSAVGLEAFSPDRTFPLAATMGKLANIVGELGDINRAEEGVLKQYTSGDIITVERKHRDPVLMTPTAKLIFATNNLPVFRDKTNGIFRRIFLVPMEQQVLDTSKQDKRLVDPNYWLESGEIEGVFVWALNGLKRLKSRGYFVMPKKSEEAKGVYRAELNPAARFLEENFCEGSASDEIISTDLREGYVTWCQQNGFKPQSETKFAEEVRRKFPIATYSENAVTRNRMKGKRKLRARVWTYLKPIERMSFLELLKDPIDNGESYEDETDASQ